jgi:dTDP-4-amino-4,6-dideoxygalactose transaminase
MIEFLNLKKLNAHCEHLLAEACVRTATSGWYVLGQQVQQFEQAFAEYCGTRFAVGVGNGLEALQLILQGYAILGKLKPGDEVIVPANTYIASVLAIANAQLVPVLAEPDANTFNLAAGWEQLITSKTKAVMPVHLYGQTADMNQILPVAQRYNLLVIEDAAQAHGAFFGHQRAGNLGHAAGFSFYPTKNLGALGDAGGITTNDEALYEVVKALRNYGSKEKYVHEWAGMNSRLDEMQASVLNAKLPFLDAQNEKRRALAHAYSQRIAHTEVILPTCTHERHHVWHLYVIRCKRRNALKAHLEKMGIQTMIHYPIPLQQQEALGMCKARHLPTTTQLHHEILSLPLAPYMDLQVVENVAFAINSFL